MSSDDCVSTILLCGSWRTRAGLSTDAEPRLTIPSVVERVNNSHLAVPALERPPRAELRRVMSHGSVESWIALEAMWQYCLGQVAGGDRGLRSVVASMPSGVSLSHMQKAEQIMFECFELDRLCLQFGGTLAAVGAAPQRWQSDWRSVTMLVVDCGHESVRAVPIVDGVEQRIKVGCLQAGGCDITDAMMRALALRGHSFCTTADRALVEPIKHQVAYVAVDPAHERQRTNCSATCEVRTSMHSCDDIGSVTLEHERFECCECLFGANDAAGSMGSQSLTDLIRKTISSVQPNERTLADLYGNVVLVGGTANLPGLAARLQRELEQQAPPNIEVQCRSIEQPHLAEWRGSLMSAADATNMFWTSKESYDEAGATGSIWYPRRQF